MTKKTKKAWGGRFDKKSHPLLEQFNASLPFDHHMFEEDIDGSIAHSRMLAKIGVLTKAEQFKIEKGLIKVGQEIEAGKFDFDDSLEDIHMAVETRLTQIIGPLGGKLHTARSRNDQVALDFRLFCVRRIEVIIEEIAALELALIATAEKKGFIPMPGYTHLQRAQPVLLAHHLLAYVEMLERDKDRLKDTLKRTNISPLGSGALAGTTFPVDRAHVAKTLGMNGVTNNSLDSVSDRDFAVEILFDLALMATHLSRFAEELVLWSSQEFGFVTLPQDFCTGSSMMPQKINPDVPELIRGKTGRFIGNLVTLLTTIKGLPLAYNKDLQEDKEPVLDSLSQMLLILNILTAMTPGITFHAERLLKATEEGFLTATDLADYLVQKKIPFREAHEIVGTLIRHCISKKTTLEKMTLDEMKRFCPAIAADVYGWLDVNNCINRRTSVGGTATKRVKAEILRLKKLI